MRRLAGSLFTLALFIMLVRPALADAPGDNSYDGKILGEGVIYLYANDEARNSTLNNVLNAVRQLEGKQIAPGEVFSFNAAANLLQDSIPYDLGPDVRNNLVKAGGVCMVSTMVATAVHDAGLPFVNDAGKLIRRPTPHSRYYKYYHQVNWVGDRLVPIVEASVAIQKDVAGEPWRTVQDMQFVNTSGRTLVLHFETSFTAGDLDLSQPFGLVQRDTYMRVQLLGLYNGFDAWFTKMHNLSLN